CGRLCRSCGLVWPALYVVWPGRAVSVGRVPPISGPSAEVDISLELVRRLLRDQHPDLADRPLSPLAEGWDNAMFRLGQHFLVRLPRRQVAADLVANEQRWLP